MMPPQLRSQPDVPELTPKVWLPKVPFVIAMSIDRFKSDVSCWTKSGHARLPNRQPGPVSNFP